MEQWGTDKEVYTRMCMMVLKHRYLYYVLNDPELADTDYDKLEKELQEYERKRPDLVHHNSPANRVGSSNPLDYPKSILRYFEGREAKKKVKEKVFKVKTPKKETLEQESLF